MVKNISIKSVLVVLEYGYDSLLFFWMGERPKERDYTRAAAAAKSISVLCGRPFCSILLGLRPGSFPLPPSSSTNTSADLRISAAELIPKPARAAPGKREMCFLFLQIAPPLPFADEFLSGKRKHLRRA